jgi:hypothetical protein
MDKLSPVPLQKGAGLNPVRPTNNVR